ncbi:MAG: LysE family translocator [Flavisolibacter sp.]
MGRLLRVFFAGMIVSFLGSLPMGTLNVAAMQIAITEGVPPALLFAVGMLLVEMVYVRISLVAMDWVRRQKTLLKILDWLTVAIVLALAASSFYAALHPQVSKNVILSSTLNKFLLGVIMCAVNPVQIPFWFGWSTVLFTKKILLPQTRFYNLFIIGIGIGTFLGTMVFIYAGKLVSGTIQNNQSLLNWIIGGIFLLTALLHTIKIFRHRSVDHQVDHPEEVLT